MKKGRNGGKLASLSLKADYGELLNSDQCVCEPPPISEYTTSY